MKYQAIGTLKLPLLRSSLRMFQGKLKSSRQRVCQDFIKITTEWKSIESNATTKFILQISLTIILVTVLFKSQLLVVKE